MLGIFLGVVGGLVEPLMIATVVFVYSLIFQPTDTSALASRLAWAPAFLRDGAISAEQAFARGVQAHTGAVAGMVALIPVVILLRGVLSYLNV